MQFGSTLVEQENLEWELQVCKCGELGKQGVWGEMTFGHLQNNNVQARGRGNVTMYPTYTFPNYAYDYLF